MKIFKITVLTLAFLSCFVRPTSAQSPTVETTSKPTVSLEQRIDARLDEIFGEKAKIAQATIFHESGNNLTAKNYNCRYGKKSTTCKKGDESKAWSVDCGIGQINVLGQVCPAELLTFDGNMKAIAQKYKEQGLNAWVSYKTGAYKQFL